MKNGLPFLWALPFCLAIVSCVRKDPVPFTEIEYHQNRLTGKWAIYDNNVLDKKYLVGFELSRISQDSLLGYDCCTYSDGTKFLFKPLFKEFALGEGRCFTEIRRDANDCLYAVTDAGVVPLERYGKENGPYTEYRRNGNSFLFKSGGKWGIKTAYLKENSLMDEAHIDYVKRTEAVYDNVIEVRLNIFCSFYLVQRNGEWSVLDYLGDPRRIMYDFNGTTHTAMLECMRTAGHTDVTDDYVRSFLALTTRELDPDKKYAPLGTKCSFTGNATIGLLNIDLLSSPNYAIFGVGLQVTAKGKEL